MDNISKYITQEEQIAKLLESLSLSKKSPETLEIKTRGQIRVSPSGGGTGWDPPHQPKF